MNHRSSQRPAPTRAIRRKAAVAKAMPASAPVLQPAISARLRIGAPHDHFEKAAEHSARTVLQKPRPAARPRATAKSEGGRNSALPQPGQPLPQPVRGFFESRFGHDFSQVRIHTGAQAAGLAEAVHARAFAIGRDVVFGAGEFAPETRRGRELLAHELTHVVQDERGAAESSSGTIRRQPKPGAESPEFPDFPHLALKLEDEIGQNLFDYGHHFYRLATLYPDRPQLLQEAFGRYALGANVLETGFRFLGLDRSTAKGFTLGTGILFKGLNFATTGEVVLDFQFDIGKGVKLETNFRLGVNPDDFSQVRKADVGLGLVGHF